MSMYSETPPMTAEPLQAVADGIAACLPRELSTSDGHVYRLKEAITDCRECHEGTPREARILFFGKETTSTTDVVVKVKIQLPGSTLPGPSTTTAAEMKALQMFKDSGCPMAPHLIANVQRAQDERGPLPGGYINYTFMTKMPGQNLLDYKFWSAGFEERSQIQRLFVVALKSLWALGIAPTDRALRNVIWESETKRLSIVDFESWETPPAFAMDEEKELQRWGLAQRPPPGTWIDEWKLHQ